MATLSHFRAAAQIQGRRLFSSSAALNAQQSKLSNGVTVITDNEDATVSTVSVVVKAGTRAETTKSAGATKLLQGLVFQSTDNSTAFKKTREVEAVGGEIDGVVSREFIQFVGKAVADPVSNPEAVEVVAGHVVDSVAAPAFHPWEMKKQVGKAQLDMQSQDSTAAIADSLHHTAFRSALGNSLSSYDAVAHVSNEAVVDFYKSNFVGGNVAFVASGMSHADACELAKPLESLPAGSSASDAASFRGGQEHHDIAFSSKSQFAFGFYSEAGATSHVLAALVEAESGVKRGSGAAASSAGADLAAASQTASLSGFTATYSDASLFGIYGTDDAETVAQTAAKVAAAVKKVYSGDFTDEALEKAKNKARLRLLDMPTTQQQEFLAAQALNGGSAATPESTADALSKLTSADVKKAAKSTLDAKPVFVSSGAAPMPYLEDIF